jgi:hypothetical protein
MEQPALPIPFGNAKPHLNLIPATRVLLKASGKPRVIENVEGAREWLIDPTPSCGTMFDLEAEGRGLQRHRLFETSFLVTAPSCRHSGARCSAFTAAMCLTLGCCYKVNASVLNGDDQDRCRLSSPFAGPPPRSVSSPSRPQRQVSFVFEWALSCRRSSLVHGSRTRVFFFGMASSPASDGSMSLSSQPVLSRFD